MTNIRALGQIFKTQFEKEYSEEVSDEEVFLIAEPLVKEPSQEEMEKAICNLKINKLYWNG